MSVTFDQVKTMLDKGIIGVVEKKNTALCFPFGFRGGAYLGAPGKDIFFILPYLSDKERHILSRRLSCLYPKTPPGNHVKWAACIRYIYGCFEKQGCLRSKHDKLRMISENTDWNLPMQFMDEVASCFEKDNNRYGLVLHYEMLAHRWGDRAIIENSVQFLDTMLGLYHQAQSLGKEIKSWKHTFTPFFWAAGYLSDMKDSRAIKYHKLNLKMMSKYCPDARDGYREKARTSLYYIKKNSSSDDWSQFYRKYCRRKNKCLRKVRI